MTPCERKCWTCGNVAMHEDNVTPWVLCKKCGSQDTRLTKPTPGMQKIDEEREHAQVGALLAKCESFEVERCPCKCDWHASILQADTGWHDGYGPTQLAAIRAAVEDAEQGVRE